MVNSVFVCIFFRLILFTLVIVSGATETGPKESTTTVSQDDLQNLESYFKSDCAVIKILLL